MSQYAKRITDKITKPDPVLIGVSFGGILVQEMAQFITARKVIIISSVKNNLEFPKRLKVIKATKAYKLFHQLGLQMLKVWLNFHLELKLINDFNCMRSLLESETNTI